MIVEDTQQDLVDQISRLQKKVVGIDEKSDRAFGLKAEIENKSKELDQIVDAKLEAAKVQMMKKAERVEDSVRDRIQVAKDDTWDEFSAQMIEVKASIALLQEQQYKKD